MNLSAAVGTGVVAALVAVALSGCTADPITAASGPTQAAPTPHATTSSPAPIATAEPSPTPPRRPYDAEREAEYQAEIAAWQHPLPEGYAWPESWTDLPYLGGEVPQQTAYLNAGGIYHCMMIGAAWDAYFRDNDPVASKLYAATADEFTPEGEYNLKVTNDDGTIRDSDLASESGICLGFVGHLTS